MYPHLFEREAVNCKHASAIIANCIVTLPFKYTSIRLALIYILMLTDAMTFHEILTSDVKQMSIVSVSGNN